MNSLIKGFNVELHDVDVLYLMIKLLKNPPFNRYFYMFITSYDFLNKALPSESSSDINFLSVDVTVSANFSSFYSNIYFINSADWKKF